MNKRIAINLGVFGALAVVMTVWAFTNVVRFDAIDRPYHLTVEFESSPGLHPNFEVDYLGVRVGHIQQVRLAKDRVVVRLGIDRGVKIPQGSTAAAARKSAVGEPVVELTPAPGMGHAAPMRPGTVIPKEKTSVPPKYGDLFAAVINTLKAIKPEDAKIITHELAAGWSGRQDSLRQIIQGSDQLAGTFAQNSQMLDGLVKDLSRVSTVLNQNRGALGEGVDNLATLTGALSQMRGQLAELRDRTPGLLTSFNTLLDKSGDDFDCMVDNLGTLHLKQYDPQILQHLAQVFSRAPALRNVLNGVIGENQGQVVLNVAFMFTLKTQAALEYKYPLPQPKVTTPPTCPGGRVPGAVPQKPYKGKSTGDTIPTHDPALDKPSSINAKNASGNSGSSSSGPPAWLVYVPPVVALMILVRVMMGSVPVMSRLSRLPRPRRRRK
ncbi:MCE family protein [Actinomadura rupiterrae]|uniref:MCE family protein n=1 Tax=Actinomadura rupiterrae TaxID=559627 RepID=UPI0020A3D21B|nr:MlaD family protein [Actinomadura rupiterrae]MCP2334774.1 phospholipid/cholesterol/gamma-HCH transport system substrate-binding protein [Actinomadura rupiterrae]